MKSVRNILVLLLLIHGVSCKKRLEKCGFPTSKVENPVGFIRFTPDQVDTVILQQFSADEKYSPVRRTDTLVFDSLYLKDSVVYFRNTPDFFSISEHIDLGVILPATGDTFKLHARYPNISEYSRFESERCPFPRILYYFADEVLVNGRKAADIDVFPYHTTAFITP